MLPLEAFLGGFPIAPFAVGPGRNLQEDVVVKIEVKDVDRAMTVDLL